jgi:hypothetical protein
MVAFLMKWPIEAIATVVAAIVGVAGTHIGHVTGR